MFKSFKEIFLIKKIRNSFFSHYARWSPDLALRYLPVVELLEKEASEKSKILEVGSGSFGITPFLRKKLKIIGVDVNFSEPSSSLKQVIADASNLPFADQSFEFVLCIDVLEHVNPRMREAVINEIFRVCSSKLFLALPCGIHALQQDEHTDRLFLKIMGRRDKYLKDHIKFGLLEKEKIIKLLHSSGFSKIRLIKNVNIWLRYFLLKFQFSKNKLYNFISSVIFIILTPLFRRINFGPCYRLIFIASKESG